MSPRHVTELVLADATGVWAIRSTSPTTYFIDTDSLQLLRALGPGSTPGLGDDRWVPLIQVKALFGQDEGVIRVGDRHVYTYDYDSDGLNYGWWLQRLVTSIDYVEAEELASLPTSSQDDPR